MLDGLAAIAVSVPLVPALELGVNVETAGVVPETVTEPGDHVPETPDAEKTTVSPLGHPPEPGVAMTVTGVPAVPLDALSAIVKLLAGEAAPMVTLKALPFRRR